MQAQQLTAKDLKLVDELLQFLQQLKKAVPEKETK